MRRGWVKWWDLQFGRGVILEDMEKLLVSYDRSSIRDPRWSSRREDPCSFELRVSDSGYSAIDVVPGHSWRSHGST